MSAQTYRFGHAEGAQALREVAYSRRPAARAPALVRAVVASLFTWRQAAADDSRPNPGEPRRGWWADDFGSRLWLLARTPLTRETINRARDYAAEALAWVTEQGFADQVDVRTSRLGQSGVVLEIDIRRGSDQVALRFDNLWEALRG